MYVCGVYEGCPPTHARMTRALALVLELALVLVRPPLGIESKWG